MARRFHVLRWGPQPVPVAGESTGYPKWPGDVSAKTGRCSTRPPGPGLYDPSWAARTVSRCDRREVAFWRGIMATRAIAGSTSASFPGQQLVLRARSAATASTSTAYDARRIIAATRARCRHLSAAQAIGVRRREHGLDDAARSVDVDQCRPRRKDAMSTRPDPSAVPPREADHVDPRANQPTSCNRPGFPAMPGSDRAVASRPWR